MSTILHLMTQDDQPYGSTRKCCEVCGVIPWNYTDDRKVYENIKKTGQHEGLRFTVCEDAGNG
jgi:hypothetical protein